MVPTDLKRPAGPVLRSWHVHVKVPVVSGGAGNRGRGRVVSAAIQALERRLNRACDVAGVQRFNPHGLRRMVVDRLLRSGVDPRTAATLTGHSVAVMLKYYQQVSDEDRRTAVEQANLASIGS